MYIIIKSSVFLATDRSPAFGTRNQWKWVKRFEIYRRHLSIHTHHPMERMPKWARHTHTHKTMWKREKMPHSRNNFAGTWMNAEIMSFRFIVLNGNGGVRDGMALYLRSVSCKLLRIWLIYVIRAKTKLNSIRPNGILLFAAALQCVCVPCDKNLSFVRWRYFLGSSRAASAALILHNSSENPIPLHTLIFFGI